MAVGQKRWGLHVGLFIATFLMATWVQDSVYALTIMTILLAHELGHYFMCKKYGVEATFPIFIPMPNILGTMGAVIAMKSPIPNRQSLFDIGIAGPLVGLIVALPAIVIGLFLSDVVVIPKNGYALFLGEPLLFSWISSLIHGPIPENHDLVLHSIAFAGWAALFVTSINLFPVGQLDGGHMIHAMLGRHAHWVSWLTIGVLVFLGFQYHPMWFIFTVIIVLFVFRHPPPIEHVTPISRSRHILGLFTYALLFLCFTPVPFEFRFSPF